jgi:2-polyprenyl-3-methyl-5-hydroxy-6-metoxy-1,4-benzoquinol methylase
MPDYTRAAQQDVDAQYSFMLRHVYAPYQQIDAEASVEQLAQLYARIENTWAALGEADPHWSVITGEQYRKGSVEDAMESFLEMGYENVDRVASAVARQGLDLADTHSVIDFGCGVGRVSAAFAARGCAVTGVDISAAHLQEARAHFDKAGLRDAEFSRLSTLADIEALPQVDLVYSLIVLQHNPPPLIAKLLRALLGRVRDGGLTYFQVPTYKTGYHYDIAQDLGQNSDAMEMHVLAQSAVFQILKEEGFSVLEVTEDGSCGDADYRSSVFLAMKAPKPPKPNPPKRSEAPAPPNKSLLSRLNAKRKALRRKG